MLFPLEREISHRSATGIATRLNSSALFPLLDSAFLLFLAVLGLLAVQALARTSLPLRTVVALPRRPTAGREWALGVALGWAVPLIAVLVLVLSRSVQFGFWTERSAFSLTLTTLLGLLATTLAVEITFRGLPFRWLSESLGPAWASVLLSVLFALIVIPTARHSIAGFLVAALLGLLLAIAWLRTHALWLSWGLSFAWAATLGVLFGLPVAGSTGLSSFVQADLEAAPLWLGGALGPDVAPVSFLLLLFALPLLVRATRDYAWNYTHMPIVPAGYPMDVPPPPAHAAMEASAPPPLIQILPQTPSSHSHEDAPTNPVR